MILDHCSSSMPWQPMKACVAYTCICQKSAIRKLILPRYGTIRLCSYILKIHIDSISVLHRINLREAEGGPYECAIIISVQ